MEGGKIGSTEKGTQGEKGSSAPGERLPGQGEYPAVAQGKNKKSDFWV